jgi:hypothetical protein
MSIFDKKVELLKGVPNKTLWLLKNQKKSTPYLKVNTSFDHHSAIAIAASSKEKLRQKENLYKQISSNKKIIGNHKSQNSDFSEELKPPYRLKTELADSKTSKFDVVRFNTEVGDGCECFEQRSTIKKKAAVPKKTCCYTTNLLKTSQKPKLLKSNIE